MKNKPGFDSRKLSVLYNSLSSSLTKPLSVDTVYNPGHEHIIVSYFSKTLYGKLCELKIEEQSDVIVHAGVSLFNTDMKWEYNQLTRFIERFFLELLTGDANQEIEKAQTEHGKNGISDLSLL